MLIFLLFFIERLFLLCCVLLCIHFKFIEACFVGKHTHTHIHNQHQVTVKHHFLLILIVGLKIRLYKWKLFSSFCFHFHLFAPRLSIVEALQYYTIHIHFNCIACHASLWDFERTYVCESVCICTLEKPSANATTCHTTSLKSFSLQFCFTRNVSFLLFCHTYLPGYLHRIAYA